MIADVPSVGFAQIRVPFPIDKMSGLFDPEWSAFAEAACRRFGHPTFTADTWRRAIQFLMAEELEVDSANSMARSRGKARLLKQGFEDHASEALGNNLWGTRNWIWQLKVSDVIMLLKQTPLATEPGVVTGSGSPSRVQSMQAFEGLPLCRSRGWRVLGRP
jgi:hypothetical protein